MKNYKFTIKETLERIVEIEAPSNNAAFEIVSKMYIHEDIVLTADDFSHVSIKEETGTDHDSFKSPPSS